MSTLSPQRASDAPEDARSRHHRSDRVLGLLVVLLWVAWLAVTLTTRTVEVDAAHLEADLAAGRVVAYQPADGVEEDQDIGWVRSTDVRPAEEGEATAVAYWVDRPLLRPVVAVTPSAEVTMARLAAAGVPEASSVEDPARLWSGPQTWGPGLSFLLVGCVLAGLAVGAGPVWGSRWFWLFLLLLPLGLGALAYAVVELVRPGSRVPRERMSGIKGLGLAVLGSLAVAGLLGVAASATGWTWLLVL